MEVWSSVLIALLLFLAAGWLIDSHLRTWRRAQQRQHELEPNELDYRRRQFRRRMQTSTMLGLIGLGILVGQLLSWLSLPSVLMVLYWIGLMLMALWLGLLALADVVSTRAYFGRLKQDYLVREAQLHAELRRLKRSGSDGQSTEELQKDNGESAMTNDK